MNPNVSSHPLVRHKVRILRDETTPPEIFRGLVAEISQLLFFDSSRDLQTKRVSVRTPLATCQAETIADRVGLVPILRAGLGMADAILSLLPRSKVYHLGLKRDHDTHQPALYYNNLPMPMPIDIAYVLDPMLATGGSTSMAIATLKSAGVTRIRFLGLIGAPEGVKHLSEQHPDVEIFLAALDERLDENCYIVPGLGDAGDRQFGT